MAAFVDVRTIHICANPHLSESRGGAPVPLGNFVHAGGVSSCVMDVRLRSFWVFVVAGLLFGSFAGLFAETVKSMPAPTNYVNDYAGVLNDATKSDLDALLKQADTQAKAQVFVAVIKKIDDDSTAAEFGNQLYAKWKPGPKADSRGVLLLISVEDHTYWIEVGYGLEGILPDGKTGDIGREMVPDLKASNYDGAVRTAVNDIVNVIAQDANVTLTVPQQPHTYHREAVGQTSHGSGIIGLLVFLFVLFLILRGGGRGGRGGGPGGFLTGMILGGMMGGNRGGWGGGDGGGSFGGGDGGGGGGFGGGEGGSSGGGGAGGSW